MKQNQFAAICSAHLVAPELALENPDIVEAIKRDNIEEIKNILANDF